MDRKWGEGAGPRGNEMASDAPVDSIVAVVDSNWGRDVFVVVAVVVVVVGWSSVVGSKVVVAARSWSFRKDGDVGMNVAVASL